MHLNTPAVGARFPLRGTKKPCETQRATANRNMVGVYPSRHSGYSNYNISQQRTGCQKKIPTPPQKVPQEATACQMRYGGIGKPGLDGYD